jgi:hypothetical protein
MKYGIYFDNRAPAEALRQALSSVYGIVPSLVYVGTYEGLNTHPGPDPVALITPTGSGQFPLELSAGDRLAEMTGASEIQLAQELCKACRTRALVDDGSVAPDYWILVAPDGSYGHVQTDPDSDDLVVLHAFEPIAGEPDLSVVPPPDWAKTW